MDKHIAELYEKAPRFDEGELLGSEEYRQVKLQQEHLRDLLMGTFGRSILPLLDDYTGTLFDEMECEAKHYFQEGYRAGRRDG